MNCTLIFNYLNDIIYVNPSESFVQHIDRLAVKQGLTSTEEDQGGHQDQPKDPKFIDNNVLIQIFSVFVSSHRFMREQFGNTYSSVQCEDGTNIVFLEQNDFLYMQIGMEDLDTLRRLLGVCHSLVLHICGADISFLKFSGVHKTLLDDLLTTWRTLYNTTPSFLLEAVESPPVAEKYNAALIRNLISISNKLGSGVRVNTLVFYGTKVISWQSSKGSIQLSPRDILFLNLLTQKSWGGGFPQSNSASTTPSKSTPTGKPLPSPSPSTPGSSADSEKLRKSWLQSYLILFQTGGDFIPHNVLIGQIQREFYLVMVIETLSSSLTTALSKALHLSNDFHSSERSFPRDKVLYESLEVTTRKILDLMKRFKLTHYRKELTNQFERFKSGFSAYSKSRNSLQVQILPLIELFRESLRSSFHVDNNPPPKTIESIWRNAKADLSIFHRPSSSSFLRSTSIRDFLEDFPGLVYFMYIDRSRHEVTLPSYDAKDDEIRISKRKIWGMVAFAREHMKEGHFSLMWKDSAFSYAYFLWFEDSATRAGLRPPNQATPLPFDTLPGILCGDFYRNLLLESFGSGCNPDKIRVHEIYCVHLGLATPGLALEASKRLASTIWEITGGGGNCTGDIL